MKKKVSRWLGLLAAWALIAGAREAHATRMPNTISGTLSVHSALSVTQVYAAINDLNGSALSYGDAITIYLPWTEYMDPCTNENPCYVVSAVVPVPAPGTQVPANTNFTLTTGNGSQVMMDPSGQFFWYSTSCNDYYLFNYNMMNVECKAESICSGGNSVGKISCSTSPTPPGGLETCDSSPNGFVWCTETDPHGHLIREQIGWCQKPQRCLANPSQPCKP